MDHGPRQEASDAAAGTSSVTHASSGPCARPRSCAKSGTRAGACSSTRPVANPDACSRAYAGPYTHPDRHVQRSHSQRQHL